MTTRVIYKYPMTEVSIRVPYGVIRHIAPQTPSDPLPTVWVEHGKADLDNPDPEDKSMIEITLVGTGHSFDDGWHPENPALVVGKFFQTAVCMDGRLVFHCFERAVSG